MSNLQPITDLMVVLVTCPEILPFTKEKQMECVCVCVSFESLMVCCLLRLWMILLLLPLQICLVSPHPTVEKWEYIVGDTIRMFFLQL